MTDEQLNYIVSYFDENDFLTDAIVNKLTKLADRVNLIDEDLDEAIETIKSQNKAIIELKKLLDGKKTPIKKTK